MKGGKPTLPSSICFDLLKQPRRSTTNVTENFLTTAALENLKFKFANSYYSYRNLNKKTKILEKKSHLNLEDSYVNFDNFTVYFWTQMTRSTNSTFSDFLCFSQEFTDSGLGNGLGLISLNDASRNLRGFVIEARSLIPQNTLPVAATDYSNRNENDRNYRLVPDKKYDP